MKLKELLKAYYKTPSDVTMSSNDVISKVFKELILPGSFRSVNDYRKTLSWNLDRDVYYREVTKENDLLYVTMTTGKMDFYVIFEDDKNFTDLLETGLKKHRSYRKESLPFGSTQKYFFYSKKYE